MAPTDSRLRPDQRIIEEGDFEGANKEKVRRRGRGEEGGVRMEGEMREE